MALYDINMTTLEWVELRASEAHGCHVQRAFYKPAYAFHEHDHDFAELFFIESGSGEHHHARVDELKTGHLGLVAPNLKHFLKASKKESMQIINIAIDKTLWDDIKNKYYKTHNVWPWDERAGLWNLSAPDQIWFLQAVKALQLQQDQRLHIDAFLLGVLQRLDVKQQRDDELPMWLSELIALLDQPRYFVNAIEQLCEYCGKGREYLSRCMKKYTGKTTIEMINAKRMEYAAQMLMESEQNMELLIDDCGFTTHAQFYRLFKKQFGVTPKQFRREHAKRAI